MGSDVRVTLTVSHLSTIAQLLAHFLSKRLLQFTLNHIVPSPAAPMGPLDSKMYLSLILILFFYQDNQREQFDDEHRPKIEWNTYFQNLTKKYTKQLSNYLCLNVIGQQFRLNHWLVIVLIRFPFHHSKAGFDHFQIDAD